MKRLLLDTHVVLWWLSNNPNLGAQARDVISEPANEIAVSAVSAVEIAVKQSLGKLRAPDDFGAQLGINGFTELPLTVPHGLEVRELPLHHRDPFDRLLIAQARSEGRTLLTADQVLYQYDVSTLAADR